MARQLLSDISQEGPRALIVLFCLGGRQVNRKLVKMIKEGSANLFVRGVSRPEVHRCSAGDARDASKRRRPKLLVLCHQKARPGPQILEEPVDLPVQFMVFRDFPVSLLDVLHYVNYLA